MARATPAQKPAPDPRRAHYGRFYGLDPIPDDRPLLLVHGNCQAESLRIMLGAADVDTLRIPPVHELTAADVPHLRALLPRVAILVTQPVHPGYHDLPLGTEELIAQLPPDARVARVPVIRYSGLHPLLGIVRSPGDRSLVPPVVAYTDLRTLCEAAGQRVDPGFSPTPSAVREVAAASLAELTTREQSGCDVVASDLFETPHFGLMRTINHPGNPVFTTVAARVRAFLGLGALVVDPGRELLSSVIAPREAAVVEAFGLGGGSGDPDWPASADWSVDGERVGADVVRSEHLDWFRRNPDTVGAGLERHSDTLRMLGLG
ncbi:MAG: hypothetical protein H7146_14560 [Burkholderiaceae bacterium]|nr:hypothetical protein [Microbacteriaceae bacterium]